MLNKLSDAFLAAAAKYMVAVDIPKGGSNQHEIGGLVKAGIGNLLTRRCDGAEKAVFPATYIRLDDSDAPLVVKGDATWYDARHKNPSRPPEYRLYYRDNEVSNLFAAGDFLLVALSRKYELLVICAPRGSEAELKVRAIFEIENLAVSGAFTNTHVEIGKALLPLEYVFADALGVELSRSDDESLTGILVDRFGLAFPSSREFSAFARSTLTGIDPVNHPDEALISWQDQETRLFKLLEHQIILHDEKFRKVLSDAATGGEFDTEALLAVAKSILNRRKSRAGSGFQNHIEEILKQHRIAYTAQATTEGKERPDFLFPGEAAYHNPLYDAGLLRMLAAKTTLKDRWRQVLKEAERIDVKHLITADTMLTASQIGEMSDSNISLVLPSPLHAIYPHAPFGTFADFLDEVKGLGHVVELVRPSR